MRPFLVHIFTACGAACALLAMLAAAQGGLRRDVRVARASRWSSTASTGRSRARFGVAEILPRWSGDALDLVVDFTTYVFVPAYALATSGLLPRRLAIPLAIAIVVTSALYFADDQMKTADNYFRGFPALWNAVAFHLFVLKLPPWIAAAAVAVLVVLTFMPLRVLHPFRVLHLRVVNLLALAAWCALGAYALLTALDPGPLVAWGLAAIGVYFLTVGLATADE